MTHRADRVDTGISRVRFYNQYCQLLYEKAVGIRWDKNLSKWVYANDEGSPAIGFFSHSDVVKALGDGCANHKKLSELNNRAIVFATMHAFQGFFGDGASRIMLNGRVAFLGAKVGFYNSDVTWYKGNAQLYGQVTNKNLRGHSQEFATDHVDVHGVASLTEENCVEIVFIVDAYNVQTSGANKVTTNMRMTEVLTRNPTTYTAPPVQLFPMPTQLADHQESLQKILDSETVCTLLHLLSPGRAVMKGIPKGTSTSSAGTYLLLHELENIGCRYPKQVVDSIRTHYEAK